MNEVRVPTHRHFNCLPAPAGVTDLVLWVVCVDKVLHYTSAFENVYLISVGVGVCQSGNATVGVDCGEPRGFLLVGRHVYLVNFVGQTEFGQGDADFDAVRCLGCVEGYVWGLMGGRHVDVFGWVRFLDFPFAVFKLRVNVNTVLKNVLDLYFVLSC